MSSAPLQLFSAANSKFFPGLVTALGTALAQASGRFDYFVTVLDGGMAANEWNDLERHLRRIAGKRGVAVSLTRLPPEDALFANLPTRRGSSLTYSRLVIPRLTKEPRLIYLDSDVVCLRGVEDFWTNLDDELAVVAARDPLGCIGRDRTVRQNVPRQLHAKPYFNAGIIGMNARRWREPHIATRIEALLAEAQGFKYVDQSLLNIVFHDQWRELPVSCNQVLTLDYCATLATTEAAANFHYVGPHKPWLSTESIFYRHAANVLFDRAYAWVTGLEPAPRTVDKSSMEEARRKRWRYRFFRPARSREYAAGLASTEQAARIAERLWTKWGPR